MADQQPASMENTQDQTQQVTSKTPATKQKNPKRVAGGKASARKTKEAREAQKRALVEAQAIIANHNLKPADAPPDPPTVAVTPPDPPKSAITTTQWLSIISIIVSLVGVYYKREEIKKAFAKKPPPPLPVEAVPNSSISKMD